MVKKFKNNKIYVLIIVIIVFITLAIVCNYIPSFKSSTKQAKNKMKMSPYYSILHTISNGTNNKISEIFLESGNSSWGGYNAILIIETRDNVNIYSYTIYGSDGPKFRQSIIDKTVYMDFLADVMNNGILKISNRTYRWLLDPIVSDGSTYFLYFNKGNDINKVIIFEPKYMPNAERHLIIINQIEKFAKEHTFDKKLVKSVPP